MRQPRVPKRTQQPIEELDLFGPEMAEGLTFCDQPLRARAKAKYDLPDQHRCYRPAGHGGACQEFPYLEHLKSVAPRVATKIRRDSTKTTGASWKSEDAGPNRITRWAMLWSDEQLLERGINMAAFKPLIVAKLRNKAASYKDCMSSAQYLTWSVYGMDRAPQSDDYTRRYLTHLFGPIVPGSTGCLICKAPLDFELFHGARRGKAEIETAHAKPREHTPGNVGFAHRHCNIAQGDKSLDEFYTWIRGILNRAGRL